MLNIPEVHWRAKAQIPIFLGVKAEALCLGTSFFPSMRNPATVHFHFEAKGRGEALLLFWAVPALKAGCAPMCTLTTEFLEQSSLSKSIANAAQQELTLQTRIRCCSVVWYTCSSCCYLPFDGQEKLFLVLVSLSLISVKSANEIMHRLNVKLKLSLHCHSAL